MPQERFLIPEATIREQALKDGITHFAVGVAVLQDQKILIVRRVPDDYLGGNFELPGGGVEEWESLEQAVKRETLEETGLQVIAILGIFQGFDYQTETKKVRQVNFVIETDSQEVKLAPEEHDALLWVNEEDLEDLPMSGEMKQCIRNFFIARKNNVE